MDTIKAVVQYIALSSMFLAIYPAHAAPACQYSETFKKLLQQLPAMRTPQALAALERYRTKPENLDLETCEVMELDDQISARQAKLVYLTDGKHKIYAEAVEHCNELTGPPMKCNGASEDGTAHPLEVGIVSNPVADGKAMVSLGEEIAGLELVGIYQGELGKLMDGGAVQAVKAAPEHLDLQSLQSGSVLIAIYRGKGAWKYSKFVWYFG